MRPPFLQLVRILAGLALTNFLVFGRETALTALREAGFATIERNQNAEETETNQKKQKRRRRIEPEETRGTKKRKKKKKKQPDGALSGLCSPFTLSAVVYL